MSCVFFFQAEDGIRDADVTGVQTCALPISALPAGVPREPPYTQRLDEAVGAALAGGVAPPLVEELVQQGIRRRQRSSADADTLVHYQGSHDFCLDLLARRMRRVAPRMRLICTPVGSTAGLLALGRGEAQLA